MIYKVFRTSYGFRKEKPCEEAVEYLDGLGNKEWRINVTTLAYLQDFIDKYGCVVLTEDSIEIYDDYRE